MGPQRRLGIYVGFESPSIIKYLEPSEFEMKYLGTTKYCLGLQFEHTKGGIFIHQSNYIEKVLKRFHMNNAHPLSTPMVIRSLDVNKDPFRPPTHNDEILGPEVPYLSAIGALMYLANNTRPNIAFSVNLLARYSSTPTKRHWNGVKHILRYLRGTSDMGLYFERHENAKATNLVGYSDAGYLSDPHKAISQSGYVLMYGGTAISWRSTKQTLVATSSNHAELIALYEAGRECVWLRSLIHYVCESCGLESIEKSPTVYMKIMQRALPRSRMVILKATEPNTYHQNFSPHTSFKWKAKSMLSRFHQVRT
ncbi:UNVERIFIED_CONTAM: Retrovirus-related Pol polyprotein from transposon TNT 1-94 [Sesamum angustifolium]|uniref:Retrovirus-related Pol polyprotein from transposon TNT 1-94 n=1 Tax=Sesamum angustifolium TaxID=2727405 RepID=A0AAW2Q844_9LAMI